MQGLQILKNIFVRPFEAFKTDELRGTLKPAIAAIFIVNIVIALIQMALRGESVRFLLLTLVGSVLTLVILAVGAWLVRFFIRKFGADADYAAAFSGALWIDIASTPLRQLALAFLFKGAQWVLVIWTIWLSILCVKAISGLEMKKSVLVYLFAGLSMIFLISVPVLAFRFLIFKQVVPLP
jgi:hypothetical protein